MPECAADAHSLDATPPWANRTRRAWELFQATHTPLNNDGLIRLGRRLTEATQPRGSQEDHQAYAKHLWTQALDLVINDELDGWGPYGCDILTFDDLRGLIAATTVHHRTRDYDLAVLNGEVGRTPQSQHALENLCAGMVKAVWQETYGGGNAMGQGSRHLEDYDEVLSVLWQTPDAGPCFVEADPEEDTDAAIEWAGAVVGVRRLPNAGLRVWVYTDGADDVWKDEAGHVPLEIDVNGTLAVNQHT